MNLYDINPKRILILNTFGIGDVLFTTPLVASLKAAFPQVEISYVGNRRTADVLAANPDISEVYTYERDEFEAIRRRSRPEYWKKWNGWISTIRSRNFDCVFDFSMNESLGFILRLCGILHRIGFDYKGRGRFLTCKIPLKGFEDRHVAEYYLDLLRILGVEPSVKTLQLHIPHEQKEWANEWLMKYDIGANKPLIGLVPGGGASWGKAAFQKRWPPEKYAKLVDKFVEKIPSVIILMGDQNERELCYQVAASLKSPKVVAAGETDILQLAALLRRCRLVFLNDGGPLHIAVAAGVRTVSMFGPVDPKVYGPYPAAEHIVIQKNLACQPCYRQFRMTDCNHLSCLKQLDVEEVFRKVEEQL